jgi:hypothetical protein
MTVCDGDLARYEVLKRLTVAEYLIMLEQKVKING